MPKRMVDGEVIWGSSKIASLPVWAKAEYANWIPLALANGVFECDVRSIWARVYSFNRPEVTPDQVQQILGVFEKSQLIQRFKEKNGTIWGYFIGIQKEGRPPTPSRINRKEAVCGPDPPQRFLRRYVRNASEGSGSGCGSGSGENLNPPIVPPESGGQEKSLAAAAAPKQAAPSKQWVQWGNEIIEVEMGNKKRLLSSRDWESLQGSRADGVVSRIQSRGFIARIVPPEEVEAWQNKKTATA